MPDTIQTYSIGEVSQITGLPSSTIRYYDSLEFLPYLQKNSQGVRQFTQKDIDTIQVIECLKRSGLTLKEIQNYTKLIAQGDHSLKERREIFYRTRQRLLNKMDELQATLKVLDFKCQYYDRALKEGTEKNVLAEMSLSQLEK
ncbi:MerR family transcriptional regulator [uncultured Limosilactobacillus sp.]|uniref:MerR family transcriptional regulator n=1 Tax=uncultured Limosilactobacillus sp. TaxID=2837629 RepID=UPI0025D96064|nr:MerR family transcriptional regulator [uncultured Limosilactobacillus sp.]